MASSSNPVQTDLANPAAHPDQPAQTGAPQIDLHALAQKVYDLLRRELRLDYERAGRRNIR